MKPVTIAKHLTAPLNRLRILARELVPDNTHWPSCVCAYCQVNRVIEQLQTIQREARRDAAR